MTALEPFEVFAIRYARVDRKSSENFLGGDPHESGMPMDYFVWMARSESKIWVIDTGFNQAAADKRKREFLRCPTEGLRLLGVDAAEVKDVIITHMHYDHVGNFDLFPRAQFHLQDSEMAYATGRHMATPFFSHAFEVDEVVAMVRNVYKGRVSFYDGDAELAPNISLHHIGGHTKGLQVVRLWTRKGWLVLASDASHYAANMSQRRPFPIVIDVAQMMDGWDRMLGLVEDSANIIPGHDPKVMELYPAPSSELEGIVVQLA
jgi:glyoxylase-like metal-dependent hydrolase (beta-lactamase superfamily II)